MRKRFALLVICVSLVSCLEKEHELISCVDQESATHVSLKFDSEKKVFSVSGVMLRTATPNPGEKKKPLTISATSTGFNAVESYPFFGFDQRAGYNCWMVLVPLFDPNGAQWKLCAEGMSRLEWIGKYEGGKAGPQTPQADKKVLQYQDQIAHHCQAFDGKLKEVWLSIPEPGKPCDRIGIDVYEYAYPVGASLAPSIRLEGLFQGSTTKCSYDAAAIAKIKDRTESHAQQ